MPVQYHHYLIAVTLIFGLISFKSVNPKSVGALLLLILFLNLGFELAANVKWYVFKTSNVIIYNLVLGYTFIIWLILLYYIDRSGGRKFIRYIILPFFIFYLTNLLLIQGLSRFNTYSFLIGTIISSFYSYRIIYFDILERFVPSISKFEVIVVCAGLFYHVGFSVMFFTNQWGATTLEIFKDFTLYQLISYLINTCFYGLLSFAYLTSLGTGNKTIKS